MFIGTGRGGKFHLGHRHYHNQSEEYWDYSFDNLKHDIYASILEIQRISGKNKIDYFGHSQGGTAIIAALADSDEFPRERLKLLINRVFIAAPVIYSVIAEVLSSSQILLTK